MWLTNGSRPMSASWVTARQPRRHPRNNLQAPSAVLRDLRGTALVYFPDMLPPCTAAGALSKMRVIGTSGHVDQGKSTLLAAPTGVHPDRLKEEQAREMTIDLGFGWLTLPNGEEAGIVDVPGH